MNFFITFIAFLFAQNSFATVKNEQKTLLQVQLVHRHGDRTPTKAWGPNDPNQENAWPQGWGQLTEEGMRQLFYLGKTIRNRYKNLISESFDNSEVYVYSSGVERALMSAQCNMAGLFQPTKGQGWDPSFTWRPVPIHSSPVYEDWVMRSSKVCKTKFAQLVDSYLRTSPNVTNFIDQHLKLVVDSTKAAGLFKEGDKLQNLRYAWTLGGNLHIARRYNKTLSPWMTDSIIKDLLNLRAKKHGVQSQATPLIKRLNGGPFLGRILHNFLRFANGTLNPDDHTSTVGSVLKLMIYSGHDTNLAALLGVLDLYDPPFMLSYGATLIFELHKAGTTEFESQQPSTYEDSKKIYDPKDLIVKTFLMEGIHNRSAVVNQLTIPGCERDCRLDQLVSMFKDVAVWSRQELMQICNGSSSVRMRLEYATILALTLLLNFSLLK